MAETQAYAVPDLTLATTYTNPAMLPDMGVQQTQLDQLFSQTPVSMPVNDVISAIQSQYQPVPVNYGEGPYGAARFIGSPNVPAGTGATLTQPTLPTWFTPGQFDINAYSTTPTQEVSQQIATGEVYGGDSPVSQVGTDSFTSSPYSSWGQNIPNAARIGLGMLIPGAGFLIGAGQGYNQTQLGNTIGTGLSAYGGQTTQVSPTLGAVLGALGISNTSSNLANMMGKNFSSAETMYGYMDAATNPVVSQITEALLGRAGTPSAVTPEMVGVIGYAVGSEVQSMIASGASIGEAVSQVAANMGLSNSQAAAMGANAAKASVESAIQTGTPLSELNPADVAAYQDSLGSLISLLGLDTISQNVSDLQTAVAEQGQTQQEALSNAVSGLQGQISDLATSYEQQGLTQQEALNAAMADVNSQISDLSALYESQGLTQQQALDKAVSDLQGQISGTQTSIQDVISQISDQSTQISNLAAAYEQQGLSQTEALNAAMADVNAQIADLAAAYEAAGMSQSDAVNQAIGDTVGSSDVGASTGPDNIDIGGGWSPATPTPETPSTPNVAIDVTFPTIDPNTTYVDTGSSSSVTDTSGGYDYSGVDYGNSGWGTDYGGGYDSYGESPSSSSSGSGGGGGKIVCTAMNEAYGFGSFRNRIWLKYAKDNLTKAHEVGYHTLFLPLVDIGYKKDVKVVRKALEHIARHRSADLRAEMRGTKRDNLGRMYRFVLEPLCYVVGKLKGY